jgi:hypothetical protein
MTQNNGNLHILADVIVNNATTVANALRNWNMGERMNTAALPSIAGARGTNGTTRRRSTKRSRTAGARGLNAPAATGAARATRR